MSQAEASVDLSPTEPELDAIRRARYRKAAEMVRMWANEDPAYNERVGELVRQELNEEGVRCRDADESAA